jgi:hypothetical protein
MRPNLRSILRVCFAFFLLLSFHSLKAEIKIYPAPDGAELSKDYIVKINGKILPVYRAPGRPGLGGNYSFAYFDFSEKVTIEITSSFSLKKTIIRPEAKISDKSLSDQKILFSMSNSPCQLSIEPDGINSPLLLFGNPIEKELPDRKDPNLIYYGPGIHKTGVINLKDNQTLYIAGGAIIKGGVHAEGKNILILGRGILEGLDWDWKKGPQKFMLMAENSSNIVVKDIILKDSWLYSFMMGGCSDLTAENLKIIGTRCGNEDGIDICNSSRVFIKNCFIRTDDDCIAIKGMGYNKKPVDSVNISDCIFWTDVANIFRIGAESHAEVMQNITARNIDILHMEQQQASGETYSLRYDYCFTIQPAEAMPIRDLLFEKIRINWEGQLNFIECRPYTTEWSTPPEGKIDGVTFRDIQVYGSKPQGQGRVIIMGPTPEHDVKNITFRNVKWFDECLNSNSRDVFIGKNTENILFYCP